MKNELGGQTKGSHPVAFRAEVSLCIIEPLKEFSGTCQFATYYWKCNKFCPEPSALDVH